MLVYKVSLNLLLAPSMHSLKVILNYLGPTSKYIHMAMFKNDTSICSNDILIRECTKTADVVIKLL